jgi:O-antigen ligase
MIYARKRQIPLWAMGLVGFVALSAAGSMFSAPLQNNLTSGEARTSSGSRYTSFTNSIEAAKDHFPVGSGFGTFQNIYPMYEDPAKVTRFYMNHVHGDYIELALEGGLLAGLLILFFLGWWCRRVIQIWRAENADYFARAATIASGAILAHCLVDYPLRTAAVGALFAMCCGLMAEPRPRAAQPRRQSSGDEQQVRHLSAD